MREHQLFEWEKHREKVADNNNIIKNSKIHYLTTGNQDHIRSTVKCQKYTAGLLFFKALFEGLIFGGAYIWRGLPTEGNLHFKIDWASFIVVSKFNVFALFCFAFEGNFPSTSPGEG